MRIFVLLGAIVILIGAIVSGGIAFVNSLSDETNRGRNPLPVFGWACGIGMVLVYIGARHD